MCGNCEVRFHLSAGVANLSRPAPGMAHPQHMTAAGAGVVAAGGGGSRGNVLPNNAFDLMKHIREKNESQGKNTNHSMRAQVHANRLLKQELQREMIERKLMEVEDYTFTKEGQYRARAYEERLQMY